MPTDSLTLFELITPTLFVIGAIQVLGLGSILPITRNWARYWLFGTVWAVVAWYLHWRLLARLTATCRHMALVLRDWWVWLCFAIELLALLDRFVLYIALLRTTDRSAEADRTRARLRACRLSSCRQVDVFIPTYNETIEVLEKTITGALCLDYPYVKVWVLDDGRRQWLKQYCETKGVGYLNRPDNPRKAGNINHALAQTGGDFIAIFDADFVPQRNFLMRTIGFFDDPSIGIVQLPHAFYNPDPMQANLALQKSLPDEQRFFFDVIMPSRDAWNAAFCCGSNSVTRRGRAIRWGRASDAVNYRRHAAQHDLAAQRLRHSLSRRKTCIRPGARNDRSILRATPTLGARRHSDPLPRQWAVWSRIDADATATVFADALAEPGSAVTDCDRGTHRISVDRSFPCIQCQCHGRGVLLPADGACDHGRHLGFCASTTFSAGLDGAKHVFEFQDFAQRLGHARETLRSSVQSNPERLTSKTSNYARGIFWPAATLIGLTIFGLMINTTPEVAIIDDPGALPIVAFWSAINVIVLFLVCMLSLQAPIAGVKNDWSLTSRFGWSAQDRYDIDGSHQGPVAVRRRLRIGRRPRGVCGEAR